MNREVTAADYSRRLQRVVGHIWAHLDDDLDLATLAEIRLPLAWGQDKFGG